MFSLAFNKFPFLSEECPTTSDFSTYVSDRLFPKPVLAVLCSFRWTSLVLQLYHWCQYQLFGGDSKNRRQHRRVDRRTLLTVQQLDGDLSQFGPAIWAVSSDFSNGGIGFTCQQHVQGEYLRITVNEENYSVIGVVRHCRLIDESGQTYFVGIQFLEDYNAHNGG